MRVCSRCIMDETDPDISFDEEGVCNHCDQYADRIRTETYFMPGREKERAERLKDFVAQVKKQGGCIMGLSGGMDSSYALLKMIELGLRPKILVYDNGWNTKTADHNIKLLIERYNLEKIVVTINAEAYRAIQLAFLRSGVMNIEIPTDHFLAALLYDRAAKEGFRYIVHGGNIQNECIMPKAWGYDAQDWKHIEAIANRHGEMDLDINVLPHMTLLDWFNYTFMKGIKWFPILNYYNYDPEAVEKELTSFGWQSYGLKHTESIFTAVFQQYILPRKFKVDKRKAHYSSAINAGWMTREEAIIKMKEPMQYDSREWVNYVCNGLQISRSIFDYWMKQDPVPHSEFSSNRYLLRAASPLVWFARRLATASL